MKIEPSNNIEFSRGVSNTPSVGNTTGNSGPKPSGGVNPKVGFTGKFVPADQRVAVLGEKFDDKTLKRVGAVECATCAARTYQDGSNDPGVSFKAPTHLSPDQAASAVVSHEMEHVSSEQSKARSENKEVVSQSVQIFQSICPECGISYVSGGVTKTTTASKGQAPYQGANIAQSKGNLVDYGV